MMSKKLIAIGKVALIALATYAAYRRAARAYPQLAQIVEG